MFCSAVFPLEPCAAPCPEHKHVKLLIICNEYAHSRWSLAWYHACFSQLTTSKANDGFTLPSFHIYRCCYSIIKVSNCVLWGCDWQWLELIGYVCLSILRFGTVRMDTIVKSISYLQELFSGDTILGMGLWACALLDPLSMAMYTIGTLPLIHKLQGDVAQAWYIDDDSDWELSGLRSWWGKLEATGLQYG